MSVEHRLARLEQSNRRLKGAVAALGVVVVATISLAMSAGSRDIDVSTLRARKIIVVDAEGKPRIESFHALDGTFGLAINDATGARRVRLYDSPASGNGVVQCLFSDGSIGVGLTAGPGGGAVSCAAADGTKNSVVMRARPVGDAGIYVFDRDGAPRLSLLAKADRAASLTQYDSSGTRRLTQGTRAEGDAFSRIFDVDKRLRLEAATISDGTAVVRAIDAVVQEE